MNLVYKIASTDLEFENGKKLFLLYADSLNLDLSFQGFDKELQIIDQLYNKPKGALILVYDSENAIACAGIRELELGIAELKRMYTLPEYRGKQIGRKVLELCIDIARELNYNKIRLDTLPDMVQAQNLYRSLGFYEINPYHFNPVSGTVYMEKNLI